MHKRFVFATVTNPCVDTAKDTKNRLISSLHVSSKSLPHCLVWKRGVCVSLGSEFRDLLFWPYYGKAQWLLSQDSILHKELVKANNKLDFCSSSSCNLAANGSTGTSGAVAGGIAAAAPTPGTGFWGRNASLVGSGAVAGGPVTGVAFGAGAGLAAFGLLGTGVAPSGWLAGGEKGSSGL